MIEFFCIHCVDHWIFTLINLDYKPGDFTALLQEAQIGYSKCKCDYVNELPFIPLGFYYG